MEPKQSVIKNPDRVLRILRKVSDAGIRIFMRNATDPSVSVKGKLIGIEAYENSEQKINGIVKISDVSVKGSKHLCSDPVIQVEFLLMDTKVQFKSKIIKSENESLLIVLPNIIYSIERRLNERVLTNERMIGYIGLNYPSQYFQDLSSHPVYPIFSDIFKCLPVADISVGGACISTNFPAARKYLSSGFVDKEARLYLPMRAPFQIPIEVRWIKKVSEEIQNENGTSSVHVNNKIGCEFKEVDEHLLKEIRHFMKRISQAEAI